MEEYRISLQKIIDKFSLRACYLPAGEVYISNSDVNRPGLPLAGFFDYFDPTRIQIIGRHEFQYLTQMTHTDKQAHLDALCEKRPSAIIFTSDLIPSDLFLEVARRHDVPLLMTHQRTSEFMAALISYLHVELAPQTSVHGVLVEAYGEGILILGESGIGKSETAIELVKRGHRLVADDAVLLRRVSDHTLVGEAPEIIRHYVELRGIGIIDVKRIFGMGAVKDTEKVDLVIFFEHWQNGKMYDRLGMDTQYEDIMGIQIPKLTIPVHPGRNLAVIVEIAAMNSRQKKMGYNTAEEFNRRLMEQMQQETAQRAAEQSN